MYKISVIIPIYGVEKYIEKCAISLFEQTISNIQYIFVDDCTRDSSIQILESVVKRYPNRQKDVIVVHHEENLGLPAARKTGIKHATGQYIIHCDSDDWVEHDMYEILYNQAICEDYDMVFCDYYISSSNQYVYNKRLKLCTKDELIHKLLAGRSCLNPVWSVMVKASVYENDISYPQFNQSEDFALVSQLVMYSNKFAYLDKPLYHYRITPNSINRSNSVEGILRRIDNSISNRNIVYKMINSLYKDGRFADDITMSKFECRLILSSLPLMSKMKYWSRVYPEINSRIIFKSTYTLKEKIFTVCSITRNLLFKS